MANALVRQTTIDDVPALADLRRELTLEDLPAGEPRPDVEAAFRDVVGDGLRDGSWVVWVAESEGQIVAHAFVAIVEKVPRPIEASRQIGYLTNVYTRPAHRGQGGRSDALGGNHRVGSASRHRTADRVASERSISLYDRHGFAALHEPLVWINPDVE